MLSPETTIAHIMGKIGAIGWYTIYVTTQSVGIEVTEKLCQSSERALGEENDRIATQLDATDTIDVCESSACATGKS